jgi:Leucine-rich repeat (LRR) protein
LGEWDFASQFRIDGFAHVQLDDKHFMIDKEGNPRKMSISGARTSDQAVDYSAEKRKRLPQKVYSMENLEVMIAMEDCIRLIPGWISHLKRLAYINLTNNSLKRFDSFASNRNLEKMILPGNAIREIPHEIYQLASLKVLDLNMNQIVVLSEELFALTVLSELRLEYNQIKKIPKLVRNFKNLKILELSFNQLADIPFEISKLRNLEQLGLTGNNIKRTKDNDLLSTLRPLKKLKVLRIGANPCSDTSAERELMRQQISEILPKCNVVFN